MILLMAMVMAIKAFFYANLKIKNSFSNLPLSYCLLFFVTSQLNAAPSITTYRNVNFTQSLGNEKTNSEDKSVNISTVTPRFGIDYKKSKIKLNIDYSLIASSDNENNENDVSHQLNLISTFTHIPNAWSTNVSSRISQKNVSDTGLLVSESITTSDASESYIINSINTKRSHQINNNASLNSSLGLTSQGFKNESSSKTTAFALGVNIKRILPSTSLDTSLKSSKNIDNKETNSALNLKTNFIINSHYSTYLTVTKNASNNNDFDESRYALGLNWTPSQKTFVNFDIGKFGDSSSWSANAHLNLRRTSINLKHTEEVSSLNQVLIDNLNGGASTSNSSTDDALSFVKNTSFSISRQSRKLTSSLTLSKIENFSDLDNNSEKTTNNIVLSFNYLLNSLTSISYDYSKNSIKTTVDNQLEEHSVNWSSKLSKRSSYNVILRLIEQDHDQAEFDSKQNQLDFNYTLQF